MAQPALLTTRRAKLRAERRGAEGTEGVLVPVGSPSRSRAQPPSCTAPGEGKKGAEILQELLAMAQPYLDLAEGESPALGGPMPGVPINRAVRGTPPPPAGPSSAQEPPSWAPKSCPGSSAAGPGPSPHSTPVCSGSPGARVPGGLGKGLEGHLRESPGWGRSPGPQPQPSPAHGRPQRCKGVPRVAQGQCKVRAPVPTPACSDGLSPHGLEHEQCLRGGS